MRSDPGERTEAAVRMIAAVGLPDAPEPMTFSPDPHEWNDLFARIAFQRVTGLALESADRGWLKLRDDQREELERRHRDAMVWALRVEQKLLGLADAFDAAGIRFAVLKGPSVAHTVYEDPSLRSFADLDVLVRTRDYEPACDLLHRLGHRRRRPEPRPHYEVRFGKASMHKHPDDGIEVDLHRTLVLGPFGLWLDPEELMDRAVPWSLGGRSLLRLDGTAMLVNAAMHAVLGWEVPRLVPLRDQIAIASAGQVDRSSLEDWAKRWHLGPVLRHAAREARGRLNVSLPTSIADLDGLPISSRDERVLRAYTTRRRRAGGPATSTLKALPGVRLKLAYAKALALPDRDFLEARGRAGHASSYRRRLIIPVRWAKQSLMAARKSGIS